MYPFNPQTPTGQFILSAIPKRAREALPDALPFPFQGVVSVSVVQGHMVAWSCKLQLARALSVRVGCIRGQLKIAMTDQESLDLLREVQQSGVMRSFAYNERTSRWVSSDYTKGI